MPLENTLLILSASIGVIAILVCIVNAIAISRGWFGSKWQDALFFYALASLLVMVWVAIGAGEIKMKKQLTLLKERCVVEGE